MKLGFSTWGMATVDIEDAIPALAAIGYQGVELAVAERFPTRLESLDAKRRTLIRSLYATHALELPAIAAHSSLLLTEKHAHQHENQVKKVQRQHLLPLQESHWQNLILLLSFVFLKVCLLYL